MTKAYSRFLTAGFCLFLAGILAWHIVLPDLEKSETENRTLTQFPEFSWDALVDGSYTESVEKYFADQFPLRDQWMVMKARAEQFLGKREFNDIYLCDDNGQLPSVLISKVETPDQELVDKNVSYVERLEEKTDANVLFGLIPSAAEIWKDRLPAGAYSWDQSTLISKSDVDFLTPFMEHADDTQLFYSTDHHWTTAGAFLGANAILETMGKEPLNRDDCNIETASPEFYGTLYSQSGVHWIQPDALEYWVSEDGLTVTSWRTGRPEEATLYDRTYLEKKDKYSSFLGGNQPLCVIKNEAITDGSKLLVVRDSYADSLAPFLAQRFSEVHLVDLRYYRFPVSVYAAENAIDDIAVIYSAQNFITDVNLVLLTQ